VSPRPRKVSDAEVLAAAYRAMLRHGPADITLAHIAGEAGLTAGALVQRYGSRRALLLRLMQGAAEATERMLAGIRRSRRSPLAALRSYATCFARMGEGPAGLAHHLAWLQLDLTDPDFNRYAQAQARHTQRVLAGWIVEAVQRGELVEDTDPATLARLVQATIGGSLIAWAFFKKGPPAAWVRRDLEVLLLPYVRPAVAPNGAKARSPARAVASDKPRTKPRR
jgi:AcrR family transcriptional regulator